MRIASNQSHRIMESVQHDLSARIAKLQLQQATGQRVLVPSDDPIASVRMSRLSREESALTQYRDNIGALQIRLQHNETYLAGMSDDMLGVRDLMVWALDGGNTPDDLEAMASALESLRDSLLASSNSHDQEGRFLFAGTLTSTAPISVNPAAAGARYAFVGNTVEQKVVVGNGVVATGNVAVDEMAAMLNQLDVAIGVLKSPTVDLSDPVMRAEVTLALTTLDATVDSVSSKIAKLGGIQKNLEAMDGTHANVSLSNENALLTLGSADAADVMVALTSYTISLQASYQTYAKINSQSLFDVL